MAAVRLTTFPFVASKSPGFEAAIAALFAAVCDQTNTVQMSNKAYATECHSPNLQILVSVKGLVPEVVGPRVHLEEAHQAPKFTNIVLQWCT